MRTLVVETASDVCSVALFEGVALIGYAHELGARGHAERLVPMIAGLPDRGRASRILVDVGPGSFTGVRVGIAAARALALAWGAAVRGYSSTALAALAAPDPGGVAVILIGGHGEYFVELFDGAMTPTTTLASLPADAALALTARLPRVGSGAARLGVGDPTPPDAREVVRLPAMLRELPPRPIYGRAPDARPSA